MDDQHESLDTAVRDDLLDSAQDLTQWRRVVVEAFVHPNGCLDQGIMMVVCQGILVVMCHRPRDSEGDVTPTKGF